MLAELDISKRQIVNGLESHLPKFASLISKSLLAEVHFNANTIARLRTMCKSRVSFSLKTVQHFHQLEACS